MWKGRRCEGEFVAAAVARDHDEDLGCFLKAIWKLFC